MSINSKHHCDFTGSAIAVTISHNIRTAPRSHQRATRPRYLGESCSISAINFRVRLCVGPEIPLPPLASFGWEIQLHSCICLRSVQSAETLLPIASWGRSCFSALGRSLLWPPLSTFLSQSRRCSSVSVQVLRALVRFKACVPCVVNPPRCDSLLSRVRHFLGRFSAVLPSLGVLARLPASSILGQCRPIAYGGCELVSLKRTPTSPTPPP